MKPPVIVDLFAGPGGWSEALRASEYSEVGIEWDTSACATRAAAGHRTIRADVPQLAVPTWSTIEGLIASPPCQAFSNAGKRGGFDDIKHLFAHVHACQTGWRDIVPRDWSDPRTALVLEPLRWVDGLTPRWVALEQVPPVLPLWEAMAVVLHGWGYSVWAGVLNAADYGSVIACPLHATDSATDPVGYAEHLSASAIVQACAGAPAMTPTVGEPIGDALTAVGHWAKAIAAACADGATSDALARQFADDAAARTDTGVAVSTWTSAAMYIFGSTDGIAESIASSLSASWDDLYRRGKSSTTSMAIPRTTILRILRSIAATLTTGPHTGPASRTAGCGLCLDLGVPQTRPRAILMAARDRAVYPPEPTHARNPAPSLFGPQLRPWVSMADALGWGIDDRPCLTVTSGGTATGGAEPIAHAGRAAAAARGSWVVRTGANTMKHSRDPDEVEPYERPITEPAPTVDAKAGGAWTLQRRFTYRDGEPIDEVLDVTVSPAVTLTGSSIRKGVWDVRGPNGESVKLELSDGLILQGFRPDYPVQGTRTKQWEQVGNAVPPPLAAAVLGQLL